ncbi:MAG TPA: RNA polymerase sigma factor [Gemmataceae bacterium]|nr:RNA polymerase sigma factor [Gemmataceae bacterium]
MAFVTGSPLFLLSGNPTGGLPRRKGSGMSKPAASAWVQPAAAPLASVPSGETLLRVFNEMRDELVSTLWYMLGSQDDAQDVAQEAFLRCWRTQDNIPGIHNLRAWIFRVGLNAAKDLQRSAWRRKVKPFLGTEVMPMMEMNSPGQALEDQESVVRVRRALHDLRPEEKEVFLLRQNGEMTYEQIAEIHNRPVGTVKTQMRSALQKLRKVLICEGV